MLQLCNMAEKNDVRLTVKSDMQSTLMSQWLMDFNSLTHESGGQIEWPVIFLRQ